MKVLVVLALAVAVVSAGFTGTLNQQARPLLQQAIQKIRADLAMKAPARNSVEAAFQARFLDSLIAQAQGHLTNIQEAMTTAQTMVQQITAATQGAVADMQVPVSNAQTIVANLIATIQNILKPNGRAMNPMVQAIVWQVVSSPTFILAVHAADAYQCLTNAGVSVTLGDVQAIVAAPKPHGWDAFLADPAVAGCVSQLGGLTHMIESSSIVGSIQAMVDPLGLDGMVAGMIESAVSDPHCTQILNGLQLSNVAGCQAPSARFLGGLISGAWNAATGAASAVAGAASSAWNNVSTLVSTVASSAMENAGPMFDQIKDMAMSYVMSGVENMASMAASQALQWMTDLYPVASQLGSAWNSAVGAYEALHGVFNPRN